MRGSGRIGKPGTMAANLTSRSLKASPLSASAVSESSNGALLLLAPLIQLRPKPLRLEGKEAAANSAEDSPVLPPTSGPLLNKSINGGPAFVPLAEQLLQRQASGSPVSWDLVCQKNESSSPR